MTETQHTPVQAFRHDALDADGFQHGFYTRLGGASGGVYAGLNCGYGSDDNPDSVSVNRARAASRLGVDRDHLVTLYQVHSADVVTVTDPWEGHNGPHADGMVTQQRGLALGILTADCAPVLFQDRAAGVIGAAHAGWKGAIGGVCEATVKAMVDLGADSDAIHAIVGPTISQENYQVGPEFRTTFLEEDARHARFFVPSPDQDRPDHWQFDLVAYVLNRLTRCELGHVGSMNLCTYAQPEMFFSYRRGVHRGEPDYGRNLSAIVMSP